MTILLLDGCQICVCVYWDFRDRSGMLSEDL